MAQFNDFDRNVSYTFRLQRSRDDRGSIFIATITAVNRFGYFVQNFDALRGSKSFYAVFRKRSLGTFNDIIVFTSGKVGRKLERKLLKRHYYKYNTISVVGGGAKSLPHFFSSTPRNTVTVLSYRRRVSADAWFPVSVACKQTWFTDKRVSGNFRKHSRFFLLCVFFAPAEISIFNRIVVFYHVTTEREFFPVTRRTNPTVP